MFNVRCSHSFFRREVLDVQCSHYFFRREVLDVGCWIRRDLHADLGRFMAESKRNAEGQRPQRGALRLIGLGKNWELQPCGQVAPSFPRCGRKELDACQAVFQHWC